MSAVSCWNAGQTAKLLTNSAIAKPAAPMRVSAARPRRDTRIPPVPDGSGVIPFGRGAVTSFVDGGLILWSSVRSVSGGFLAWIHRIGGIFWLWFLDSRIRENDEELNHLNCKPALGFAQSGSVVIAKSGVTWRSGRLKKVPTSNGIATLRSQ